MDYSLQANRKTIEGAHHPDRNAQFEYINARVRAALRGGEHALALRPASFHGDWNYTILPNGHAKKR